MRVRSLLTALAVAGGALLASAGTSQAGDVSPLIVGGHNATQVYSFMVSLQNRSGSHFCGGSLIKADWVVTASHCVEGKKPEEIRVRVGTTNRTSGGSVATGAEIIDHPTADLALLRLSTPVKQAPVKIASASGPVGTATRIIGWGQMCPKLHDCGVPKTLQELETSIVSDSKCRDGQIDASSEICTNNTDGNKGACFGDSGGPQIKSVAGVWQLIGATSRSGGDLVCAKEPSIYVDVPYFRSWISGHAGSL